MQAGVDWPTRKATYWFAKLVALVYDVLNSFGLGYHKLLRIPLDLYQVLDGWTLTKIQKRGGHPMNLQDKSLQCSDCGTTFTFSAGEQEFFQSKGFTNEPKRCPSCRRANKAQRSDSGNYSYNSNRWMFCALHAWCRKDTGIPFEPSEGRLVYCSDYYGTVRMST